VKPSIIIITGLSGSGKSVVLRAIEDAGYFCVDNLPPQLIDSFASTVAERAPRIAVGIDVREKDFLPELEAALASLREKYRLTVVFLEADDDTLMRRFKETRRPHPLFGPGERDMQAAISRERDLLRPLRDAADRIIDTSSFTPHQLRQMILDIFGPEGASGALSVTLISFGFKFGTPQNADLIFDVRFLPNPHFVSGLKELKGTDGPVREFVLEKAEAREFLGKLEDMLKFLIPLYRREGKSYLTIGIGCTGGRHRSPAIAEKAASLIKDSSLSVNVVHRDL